MEEKKPSLWDKTKNWIMGITTLFVAGGGTVAVVNEISQADHNKNKTEKWVDPKTGRLTGLPTIPVIKREKTEQEQAKEFTDRIRRDISIAQGEISEFSPADKNAIEVEGHQMSKGASIGYGKYEDEDSHVRLMEPTPGSKEAFMAEESKKFMDNIKIERFGNKSEEIQQDKKQQSSDWRSGKVNGASVTYDNKSGFILAAMGSRKQLEGLGSHLSQEQMDSLDAENIKQLSEKISQHTWSATNPEDVHVRIVREGKKFEFPTADKNADKVEEQQMVKGANFGYGKYEDPENDHYAYSGTKEDLQAKAQKKLADAIVEKILFGKHKKVTLADVRAKSENLQQKKNGTDTPVPQPDVAEDHNREAVLPKQAKLTSTRSKGGRKGGEPLGA